VSRLISRPPAFVVLEDTALLRPKVPTIALSA
jgi:hypothetical protein